MSSSIGTALCLTTFGESHGSGVGAVLDGCPAGLALTEQDIQPQLDRRRPGQSRLTTAREERDAVEILSGTENGVTLGSPIALLVRNMDARPGDYRQTAGVPRPSHADFSYRAKYGVVASSGGGRASARETVGRVAGGAVAEKFLHDRHGVEIVAWVSSVGTIDAPDLTGSTPTRADVDRTDVRCPDGDTAARMAHAIRDVLHEGDSLGGVVTCVARNVPVGWGEPVFAKMEAALAAAMLSIPAAKGFEIGSGFAGARQKGSEHNDPFSLVDGMLQPLTNSSGGVHGGITSGAPLVARVAFKPVATIRVPQETVDYDGNPVVLENVEGRHDPCVLPRAVPVVESMAALVLADMACLAASVLPGETR